MLTIEQCRQILGEKAKNLSDKKVEEMRDCVYALADVSVEQALKEFLPNSFPSPPHDEL